MSLKTAGVSLRYLSGSSLADGAANGGLASFLATGAMGVAPGGNAQAPSRGVQAPTPFLQP